MRISAFEESIACHYRSDSLGPATAGGPGGAVLRGIFLCLDGGRVRTLSRRDLHLQGSSSSHAKGRVVPVSGLP